MMRIPVKSPSRHHAAGHTLIELMVAIIIGLVLIIAAFFVLATFEGQKRTITAMNDALQSGNFALYQVGALARSAGTGLVQSGDYGCELNYISHDASTGVTISGGAIPSTNTLQSPFDVIANLRLAPAIIYPNATAGGSDVLMLMLGGSGFSETPIAVTQVLTSNQLTLDSTVGLYANEWVMMGGGGATQCMVTTVGSTYAYAADNIVVPLSQGNVGLAAALANFASGSLAALGTSSLYSSTPEATFIAYGISASNTLVSVDLLNSKDFSIQQVSDDIVAMRVVYGVDTDNDGKLDSWVSAIDSGTHKYSPASLLAGTTAANALLNTIKAIRIAIVVRSPLSEKTAPSSAAVGATVFTMFSSLPSSPEAVQVAWTMPAGGTNYRYRELESTVPIRNASIF